jgi:SAM-dependent methyltransferase
MTSAASDDTELRFAFGKNWTRFLKVLDEGRIETATQSLRVMLGRDDLDGLSFLDAGCGSGLFSLAARRLGARVHSFDLDPHSVACCEELRRRFEPDTENWKIESGSVLDAEYLKTLGQSDVVYSWGVLHHTGQMWQAIDNVAQCVKPSGLFSLSIYNDQGGASRRWKLVKKLYNTLPQPFRFSMLIAIGSWLEFKQCLIRLVRLRNPLPFAEWSARKQERGMSYWHDLVDWVGGYPFEVAQPEEIFNRLNCNGHSLRYLTTQAGGYGCNEFVFEFNDSTAK